MATAHGPQFSVVPGCQLMVFAAPKQKMLARHSALRQYRNVCRLSCRGIPTHSSPLSNSHLSPAVRFQPVRHKRDGTSRPAPTELITFIVVLAVCLGLTIYLGVNAPADKRMADRLAQGVFSALFALPTGFAWRAFRQAAGGHR